MNVYFLIGTTTSRYMPTEQDIRYTIGYVPGLPCMRFFTVNTQVYIVLGKRLIQTLLLPTSNLSHSSMLLKLYCV